MNRRHFHLALSAALAAIGAFPVHAFAQAAALPARAPDVPYEPSPPEVVRAMLEIAKVGRDDLVYDLGSGDGRIVIEAARGFGARGVGIDIDPQRVREASANARAAGVADRVTFIQGDLFETDFRAASVVTLFLWPHINLKLIPQLRRLKPGTRIVSHIHDLGEWLPERTVKVKAVGEQRERAVHLWTVPAK